MPTSGDLYLNSQPTNHSNTISFVRQHPCHWNPSFWLRVSCSNTGKSVQDFNFLDLCHFLLIWIQRCSRLTGRPDFLVTFEHGVLSFFGPQIHHLAVVLSSQHCCGPPCPAVTVDALVPTLSIVCLATPPQCTWNSSTIHVNLGTCAHRLKFNHWICLNSFWIHSHVPQTFSSISRS